VKKQTTHHIEVYKRVTGESEMSNEPYSDFDLESQYEDRYTDYQDEEYIEPDYTGCRACGTDYDELEYEEYENKWRIFCPYCDRTIAVGEVNEP
jgi:hypothetical protein